MLKRISIFLSALLLSFSAYSRDSSHVPRADMDHDMEKAALVCKDVNVSFVENGVRQRLSLLMPQIVMNARNHALSIQTQAVASVQAANTRASAISSTSRANEAAARDATVNALSIHEAQGEFDRRWKNSEVCKCDKNQDLINYEIAKANDPSKVDPDKEKLLNLYDTHYEKWQNSCEAQIIAFSNELTSGKLTALSVAQQTGKNSNLLKYAAIGAAGVGAYMLLKGGGKKDKKDDVSSEEAKQGVIALEDGTKISCFSQQHFQRSECKSTMLRMCQSSEKETSGGCNAFNNYYCSNIGEGKDSVYCTYTATTTYCNQTGELVKESPACKWRQTRDNAACGEDPEAIGCRVAMTATELQAACANHPYDPVCKANATTVMTQPDGNSESVADNKEESGVETVNMGEGDVSLSSITSSGNSASVQTSNLENSNSAVISSLCATGQLLGCPN